MTSQIRQNFHQDCEAALNRQINLELYASYVYLSMAYYFDRDDKSLPNFAKFFGDQSKEERVHAEKLMSLQNERGGRIFLQDIRMCDFIETHFLDEQVKSIKQLADWISNLRRMGAPQTGMAEYLFDKHTMAEEGS
ncbi:ferritin%2C heavy subunit-like [Scomber scombrus]|uniref:Ferritin n=1 Tax=Scomber scombrus TaxID=13677 RepID=A0AAV1NRS1_SCOSC